MLVLKPIRPRTLGSKFVMHTYKTHLFRGISAFGISGFFVLCFGPIITYLLKIYFSKL